MVFCSKLVMKWKYIKKEKEVYKGSKVLIRFYFFKLWNRFIEFIEMSFLFFV